MLSHGFLRPVQPVIETRHMAATIKVEANRAAHTRAESMQLNTIICRLQSVYIERTVKKQRNQAALYITGTNTFQKMTSRA